MSGRVVLSHCFLAWLALASGVAQSNLIPSDAQLKAGSKARMLQAAELNRQGQDCVAAKRFEQAKALFKRAIQSDPRISDAYENLSLVLLLEGDDADAGRAATKLLALAPSNYNGALVAGIAAINRNDFGTGKTYLVPLVHRGSDDPIVMAAYAIAQENSGVKAEGARLADRLAKQRVENSDALLAGQIFRQRELRAIAQNWMETSVSSSQGAEDSHLLYMLAAIYFEQGRFADASTLYGRILEKDPDNVDALLELSELERASGQQQKSDSHLYAAKAVVGTDIPSLIHLDGVLMRRRMYVDARDFLQKTVALDSYNEHAWYQLGLAQFRIGEEEAAETDFRVAVRLDENDVWSRIGLGAVLLNAGRHPEATAEFERVLKSSPRNPAAHYYLARIDREKGKIPLAFRELHQAVHLDSKDARPWAALGQFQLEQNLLSSARVSLRKAIELDPQYSTAHYQLAMLLRRTGEQAEATREIALFQKYHDEENKKGIMGLVSKGKWDYAGFLPAD